MKMTELKAGDKAEIISIKALGEVATRLIDMGLVKGTRFKLIRKAPLGDPIEIMLRGFFLSLRLNEAENISVEKIGHVGDGKPMGGGRRGR
ncbi:MAG: ferrous iron transport protein A [Elusimicrobiales bacterium]|nr:ferrous iron transport protein A [Elusimicrobiales bacterium]